MLHPPSKFVVVTSDKPFHCLAAHETWNVGSCDDGSGPGAGWARLELGWAATATESTTMTYEGKILLIK